eukprot:GILI01045043.1.p1 GENE.GILI01045043.1~~GILI01045043.1.p1  ORF type:complete len:111 (-),score=4.35 GILI01045043.1:17-349(-)
MKRLIELTDEYFEMPWTSGILPPCWSRPTWDSSQLVGASAMLPHRKLPPHQLAVNSAINLHINVAIKILTVATSNQKESVHVPSYNKGDALFPVSVGSSGTHVIFLVIQD